MTLAEPHYENTLTLADMMTERNRGQVGWETPTVYDLSLLCDQNTLEARMRSGSIQMVVDNVATLADELYELENPAHKGNERRCAEFVDNIIGQGLAFGRFVELTFDAQLLRYAERDQHRALRTSRFKNMVTDAEQRDLYGATVATYGLSVGSSVNDALAMSGIGGRHIIGDGDTVALSNLGRIRANCSEIGDLKVDVAARKLSRLDPYIEVVQHRDGFTRDVEDELAAERPAVLFEEVDSMPAKALMRIVARRHGIPLVMASDVGDKSIIDVERYDIDKDTKPFHGNVSESDLQALANGEMPEAAMRKLPAKIIGIRNVTTRMLQSVMQIGETIPGMPQLGSAATVGGVLASTVAREIILDRAMPTGRYIFSPKQTLKLQPQATIPEALRTAAAFIRSSR